jgi:hypothetical protein
LTLSKEELETLYRKESDAGLKEWLLFVLKVEGYGMIPAPATKEVHRSRTWTSGLQDIVKKVLMDYRTDPKVVDLPNYLKELLSG